MSRKVINVNIILHEDKTYYSISGGYVSMNLLHEMLAWVSDIGDEGYLIDNDLFFDENAYMNLTFAYDGYDFIVK